MSLDTSTPEYQEALAQWNKENDSYYDAREEYAVLQGDHIKRVGVEPCPVCRREMREDNVRSFIADTCMSYYRMECPCCSTMGEADGDYFQAVMRWNAPNGWFTKVNEFQGRVHLNIEE